jgi:hypothetical protein
MNIVYTKIETQKYMLSPIFFNEDVYLLHALRSRSVDCRMNFKQKYRNQDLQCPYSGDHLDSQQEILQCRAIIEKLNTEDIAQSDVEYEDIFRNDQKQKAIVTLFKRALEIRKKLIDENLSQTQDLSTSVVLETRRDLQICIDNLSSRNSNK